MPKNAPKSIIPSIPMLSTPARWEITSPDAASKSGVAPRIVAERISSNILVVSCQLLVVGYNLTQILFIGGSGFDVLPPRKVCPYNVSYPDWLKDNLSNATSSVAKLLGDFLLEGQQYLDS